MLFLFWAPFHIVGFGIVVLVRVCFGPCLFLLFEVVFAIVALLV